jgi:hypothetical protein
MAAALGLEPHAEGGFYLETYRAAQTLRTPRGERPAATAILFLVTAESASRLHRLTSDELWVYQGGLPLELVTIAPGGELQRCVLGDLEGEALLPQALVPAGSWQGARLAGGPHLPAERAWALVSCVVTPGFDFSDFELGERDALLAAYPQHGALIEQLT